MAAIENLHKSCKLELAIERGTFQETAASILQFTWHRIQKENTISIEFLKGFLKLLQKSSRRFDIV